jgi:DNA-binding NtrC family response regulator
VRLLVVDDDPAVRAALGRILGLHYQVTLAKGYHDALAQLAEGAFDVVLCDVVMPDGSGLDLLLHLRETHPDLGRRVILMTGAADSSALQAARAVVIDKPFDLRRLEATIARVLGSAG